MGKKGFFSIVLFALLISLMFLPQRALSDGTAEEILKVPTTIARFPAGNIPKYLEVGNLGFEMLEGGDEAGALDHWRRMAEQGDHRSRFYLGWSAQYGIGQPRDPEQAAKLYLAATREGNASAAVRIGYLYWVGQGHEQGDHWPLNFWWAAANVGHPDALLLLSAVYDLGRGRRQPAERMLRDLRYSALTDNPRAFFYLGAIHAEGAFIPRDIARGCFYWMMGNAAHDSESKLRADRDCINLPEEDRRRLVAMLTEQERRVDGGLE